ncbi:hypothetical protein ABFS83_14G039300 [Erythranthe nasuta]
MEINPTFFLLLLQILFLILTGETATTFNHTSSSCKDGTIAECNYEELETTMMMMMMLSDVSRRFLEQKKYISTGALKKDQPVCSGGAAGKPYSGGGGGCVPQPSNTYNRGCSTYYRCRDDA